MGRCLACDKKGLFLRINSQGICSKCELQFQKEGTEDLFRKLLQLYTSIKNNVSVSDDPIERLNEIVKFEKKLMECEELKQEAEKIRCNETFRKYLRTKLYYAKDSDEATGLSTLRHFGTTIWTGRYSEDDPCQKLADELTEQSEKYLNGWKRTIEMIKKGAEFEKTLRTLPEVEIDLSQDPIPLKEIVNLDSLIKYSRVTSKTNYSRIGNFIAVDIETTGLSSINDNITEISAIKFEDWIPVRIFHTFINPSVEIPDVIVEKTGITNEMVAEAPVFYEIVPSLEDFIKLTKATRYHFCLDSEVYTDFLDVVVNAKLRNAIGHNDVEYDAVSQVITYIPNPKDRTKKKTEYLLEFENEALHMFQAVLGVSEYLYRLRELSLIYEGKIPLMVQERANWPKKIGRNDPCPCGSGKKYKFCHEKNNG